MDPASTGMIGETWSTPSGAFMNGGGTARELIAKTTDAAINMMSAFSRNILHLSDVLLVIASPISNTVTKQSTIVGHPRRNVNLNGSRTEYH